MSDNEGSPSNPSKREKKQLAKDRKEHARRRARRARAATVGGLIFVVLAVIAFFSYLLLTRPGESVPSMGREHVRASTPVSYNSNPPTSGPHTDASAGPGIYEEPPDDKPLVHSLEHGYVIISYNCEQSSTPCGELQESLQEIARAKELWKLIVTPRPSLDVPIALTAWTRIDKLEALDRRRIERFIDVWRDKGPEDTPN